MKQLLYRLKFKKVKNKGTKGLGQRITKKTNIISEHYLSRIPFDLFRTCLLCNDATNNEKMQNIEQFHVLPFKHSSQDVKFSKIKLVKNIFEGDPMNMCRQLAASIEYSSFGQIGRSSAGEAGRPKEGRRQQNKTDGCQPPRVTSQA